MARVLARTGPPVSFSTSLMRTGLILFQPGFYASALVRDEAIPFGTAVLVEPIGIASGEAFGLPTISTPLAQLIVAIGIASGEAFGLPTISIVPPPPPPPPLPPLIRPAAPLRRASRRGVAAAVKPTPLVLGRYTGPAFPFGGEAGNALGPKEDVAVIFTSVVNILTTPKGTIPYDPKMGSQVPFLVFEPNDEVTRNLIRYFTAKDLGEQEPRIVVYAVLTEQSDDHSVVVTVGFQIVGDPTAKQYNAPALFKREV